MARAGIFGALLMALALVGTAQARQQIIMNGSFEGYGFDPNDPNVVLVDEWRSFQGLHSDAFAFDGMFSALGAKSEGNFCGYAQDTGISVTGGVRMYMRAKLYNPSTNPLLSNEAAGIKIEFRPPEGIEVPPDEENLVFDANAPLDTWELVSYSTTVPPGINIAEIVVISFDNSDINGFVYADSAMAEVGSAPGVNQLENSSFEVGINAPDGMPFWDEFGTGFSVARKHSGDVPAHDGSFVLRMGGNTTGVVQPIPVTPGDTLDISAYFRQRSSAPYADPNAAAGVKVQWEAGGIPPQVDIRAGNGNPASGTTNIIEQGAPTDQWVEVYIDYTMPLDGAASLSGTVINGFASTGSVSQVYFDAVEFVLTNVFVGSDTDRDEDQDLVDIALLQQVFTGPTGPVPYGGLVFDHDEDGDVDFDDVGTNILPNQTGPVVAAAE